MVFPPIQVFDMGSHIQFIRSENDGAERIGKRISDRVLTTPTGYGILLSVMITN
jgi:hypothetical protein